MNRICKFAAASVAVLALAGCAGLQLQKAEKMQPQGTAFDVALSKDYLAWSKNEYREGDYRDSDFAAVRSMTAGQGGAVAPSEVGSRKIPADMVGGATTRYNRLVAALNQGARTKIPGETAKCQVLNDWLLQEQEENWPFQAQERATLQSEFEQCMAKVEAALAGMPAMPGGFLVFFDWNRSNLTPEAMEIVRTVAKTARAAPFRQILAVGHTDTSGSATYNQGLSERRADSVENALVRMGISSTKIVTQGVGEKDPLVPTGDGVREPQNRRVSITIEK